MDLDYGNCRAMETVEKQTTFSHRSHSAWKTRQPLASFPQFPQSLLLVQHKSKKPNQLIALTNYSCTSNLNRRLVIFHLSFSIFGDAANPRSRGTTFVKTFIGERELNYFQKWKMRNGK
jgi:predicted Zn-dependent protease